MSIFLVIAFGLSLIFSIANGEVEAVSNSILNSSDSAVKLTFTLLGTMAFWGGIMEIAQESGLVGKLSKLLAPVLGKLFPGIDKSGEAFGAIVMNITANLMGLGNAATPLGIKAITSLAKEENAGHTATRSMIALVVINTASIQLLPTTIATLRLSYGSESPMEILPAVLTTSSIALTVGLLLVFILDKIPKIMRRDKA